MGWSGRGCIFRNLGSSAPGAPEPDQSEGAAACGAMGLPPARPLGRARAKPLPHPARGVRGPGRKPGCGPPALSRRTGACGLVGSPPPKRSRETRFGPWPQRRARGPDAKGASGPSRITATPARPLGRAGGHEPSPPPARGPQPRRNPRNPLTDKGKTAEHPALRTSLEPRPARAGRCPKAGSSSSPTL